MLLFRIKKTDTRVYTVQYAWLPMNRYYHSTERGGCYFRGSWCDDDITVPLDLWFDLTRGRYRWPSTLPAAAAIRRGDIQNRWVALEFQGPFFVAFHKPLSMIPNIMKRYTLLHTKCTDMHTCVVCLKVTPNIEHNGGKAAKQEPPPTPRLRYS